MYRKDYRVQKDLMVTFLKEIERACHKRYFFIISRKKAFYETLSSNIFSIFDFMLSSCKKSIANKNELHFCVLSEKILFFCTL